ncbi:hypothetical protein [uncultured Lamprocystis sp.]|uniref:hypothetical protein n=1 Tax=uncultured Lamprocystis sp. TaxID=543132 RepID=UPI0025EB02B0|nr:hypothetical protein [uncultured Lamprocystis sp.]
MSAEKLERLLNDLRTSRKGAAADQADDYDIRLASVTAALADVPLLHGTAQAHLPDIWDKQCLDSRRTLNKQPLEHQICLDTYDAVYASVGVMYPQRQAAIAFASSIDEDPDLRVHGSPWDTGAFFKHVAPRLGLATDEARLDFFQKHTLAAPFYRQYLIAYVATCFACARDYLQSAPYRHPDPEGVMSAMPGEILLRIFEIRVCPSLPLRPPGILAVFLASPRFLTRAFRERVEPALRSTGIAIEYYGRPPSRSVKINPTPDDLRRFVTDWICKRTPREAGP